MAAKRKVVSKKKVEKKRKAAAPKKEKFTLITNARKRKPARDALPDSVAKDPEDAAIDDGEQRLDLPSNEALAQIGILAELQLKRQHDVEVAANTLASAMQDLKAVQEDLLPEAMREAGCLEFTLANGAKLSIKDDISCSLAKDGEQRVGQFAWLEKYNLESIIKREVSVSFGKGDAKKAEKVLAALYKMGLEPQVSETVHSSTLKATLKGVMANGIIRANERKPRKIDVPLDLFSGHAYSKAIIKENTK